MNKFDKQLEALFKKIDDKLNKAPQLAAETAVEHFQNALIQKQWNNQPYEPYKNKKREPSRGSLMFRTGNLFRSIRINTITGDTITISAGSSRVPYAQVHNEGGTINHAARTTIVTHKEYKTGKYKGKTLFAKNNENATYSQRAKVGAYSVTMPKRQFMGKSPALIKDIKTRFKNNFKTL
ncbi:MULTISPECIES: phage virion morphogenesis protein [Sphingobacterium]|uniref:phage virion morphogenesis protein n=1 Tax=Sphingobacterium TaxID=28453 RepID=UPI00257DDAE0|nr:MULTISPECIES: phage virion morphogenesis protein [Sphingobacterium]